MDYQPEQVLCSQPSRMSDNWVLLGRVFPKAEIVFFSQIIILYIIIITCIINLSLGNGSEMWLILLSTSIGAILPNPKLKSVTKVLPPESRTQDIRETSL